MWGPVYLLLLITGVISQSLSPPITGRFKCLTNGCCDQHEWCRFWASIGECSVNGDWMASNCQLACGTCRASAVRTTTAVSTTTTSTTTTTTTTTTTSTTTTTTTPASTTVSVTTTLGTSLTSMTTTLSTAATSTTTTTVTTGFTTSQFGLGTASTGAAESTPIGQTARQRARERQRMRTQQRMLQMQQQQLQQQQQMMMQNSFGQQQQQQQPQLAFGFSSQRPTILQPQFTQQQPFFQTQQPQRARTQTPTTLVTQVSAIDQLPTTGFPTTIHSQTALATAVGASTLPPQFAPPPSSGPIQPVTSCKDVEKARATEVLVASGLVDAVDDTFGRATLSVDDISRAVQAGQQCIPQLKEEGLDCNSNLCYHLIYRSFDGTCNNLRKPMQGASFRPYLRHFPPQYDDGQGEPVSSIKVTRPAAREANRVMLSSAQSVTHDKYNNLMMQFGQFISHDVAKTTLQPSANCQTCTPVPSKCMPIPISDKDPNMQFKSKQCLKVSRSAPICNITPREQLNENTAYIDGSAIYGSSPKDLFKFREGRTGLLRIVPFNNQKVLPFDQSKCRQEQGCLASFTAGDIRANLFIGLTSFHILWAREHNRIATKLQSMNSGWSGDRVFQEARKIVGAQIQHIFYSSYLPKVLGNSFERVIGKYQGYDENADATVANEFTTGAFRFGHGMIEEFYMRLNNDGSNITQGGFFFGDGVFKSGKILWEGGVDPIMRGFMLTHVKRPHRLTPATTEKMFGSTDLGSLNIQRGRDHGIPGYNTIREFCGLPRAKTFEDFGDMILDKNLRFGLSKNYNSTDDVDFYVGAMLEDPVVGGLVGTTLSCVIGEQFKRTRNGDRFYYENPGIFTARQVAELKKASFSKVICLNGDNFDVISEDAFLVPGSQLTPCSSLPEIDLTAWKE